MLNPYIMHSVMILYKLFYYWIGGTKNINKKREGNFAPPPKKNNMTNNNNNVLL